MNANSKQEVVDNIRRSVARGDFNCKVEVNDFQTTPQEEDRLARQYLDRERSVEYFFNNLVARMIALHISRKVNRDTEFIGLEKIKDIRSGAILTGNHFHPYENTIPRLISRSARRRLYIVSMVCNYKLKGILGYLVNNTNILPITADKRYVEELLYPAIAKVIEKKDFLLMYPEQEMWYNYRKPRPLKRGAYLYAARLGVPVIPYFVEMIDTGIPDNEEFDKVRYRVHILDIIYPDPAKDVRSNSFEMMRSDYQAKVKAYEDSYGKTLDYGFQKDDIAGWRGL